MAKTIVPILKQLPHFSSCCFLENILGLRQLLEFISMSIFKLLQLRIYARFFDIGKIEKNIKKKTYCSFRLEKSKY